MFFNGSSLTSFLTTSNSMLLFLLLCFRPSDVLFAKFDHDPGSIRYTQK